MKKLQAIAAGLLAAVLLACPARAMEFPDVPADSDYADAVETASGLGIMVGDDQGNFNPEQIVSRAEMAALVCRMLGVTENLPRSEVFTDVPADHWANPYVAKAAELGIVSGYGDGTFGPDDPVLYEQAVAIAVRAFGDEITAKTYGGYPNGYLQVARDRWFILEGLPAARGQGMTRGAVAMLLDNHYKWRPALPGDGHFHHYDDSDTPKNLRLCVFCGQMEPSAPSEGNTHH